jgi:putative toxin-antitoxin system antitoxin component (TIGR02293 family)
MKADELDRMKRQAHVTAVAIDVLGGEDPALRWLSAPNRGLGGETPLTLLGTAAGTHQVLDELHRLEHGIFS